jgi:hypothetical protein
MAFNDYDPRNSINAPIGDGQMAMMSPYLQALMRRQKLGQAMRTAPQFNPMDFTSKLGGAMQAPPPQLWLPPMLGSNDIQPSAPLGYDQQASSAVSQMFGPPQSRDAGGVGYGQNTVNARQGLDTSREQFQQSTTPAMSVMSGVPRAAESFRSYQPVTKAANNAPLNRALSNVGSKVQGSAKKLTSGGTKKARPSSSPTRGKLR